MQFINTEWSDIINYNLRFLVHHNFSIMRECFIKYSNTDAKLVRKQTNTHKKKNKTSQLMRQGGLLSQVG